MIDRYLHHVTLTSGHVRESYRSEVSDFVVAEMIPLLEQALSGDPPELPGLPGYRMAGGVFGRCCVVTLLVVGVGGEQRPVPVLSVGVAPHSRCGATLWREMHLSAVGMPLATEGQECPPEPWCADRIEVGASLVPDALGWTGDWSRCVAWSWIEMREGRDENDD